MKLGVFTLLFGPKPFDETLDYLSELGVQTVELGSGGYVRSPHCPTEELLNDTSRIEELKQAVANRGFEISALSCHGNPIHPDEKIARKHHDDFANSCKLAQKLGVSQVNTLSGCPGSHADARLPNWITCPFPAEDFLYPSPDQCKTSRHRGGADGSGC